MLQTFGRNFDRKLFAEILPGTKSLSRRNFQKISFFLICCICVNQYYTLFFKPSRGKLIDFSVLKHQVKTFLDILFVLNDGFHDSYNEPVDQCFPKTNRNFVYAKAVKGFQEAERK